MGAQKSGGHKGGGGYEGKGMIAWSVQPLKLFSLALGIPIFRISFQNYFLLSLLRVVNQIERDARGVAVAR